MDAASLKENVVLRDWLSFTSKKHDPYEIVEALGMGHCVWTETKGAHGYQDRLYFGNISIHYNGREDMGVWCEMSGQGCRNFEDLSTLPGKWDELLAWIQSNDLNITRFDVAFDDHTGLLDIDRIAQDTENQRFVSRFNYWESIRSSQGISVQIGSPQSKVLVRIYDKAAERGFGPDVHWVRVEMQLRDQRAKGFLDCPMPLGEAFAGVLLNYLRFVEPDETDSNKSRWSMTEYWADLIGDVSRIKIFSSPGGEYNVEKCKHYVADMAGNAIAAMLEICGSTDEFERLIAARQCKPNPKYDVILKEHHAKLEAFAARARALIQLDDDLEEVSPGVFQHSQPDDGGFRDFIKREYEKDSKAAEPYTFGFRD